jgi:uncharacterized protein (TIGR00106 family)
MLADFAVVPMGVAGGVKELVAEALKIVDESGLSYKLGAMHTTIEGDSDRVMDVILRCHRRSSTFLLPHLGHFASTSCSFRVRISSKVL